MALRGDLVGEAFVRITADTTAMRQAIRRAGEDDGKAYGEKFSAEVDRAADNTYRRSRQRLAAAISDPKQFDDLAKHYKSTEEAAASFRSMLADLDKQQHFGAARTKQYAKAVNDWEVSTVRARDAARELTEQTKRDTEAKVIQNKQLKNFFVLQEQGYKRIQAARRRDLIDERRAGVDHNRISRAAGAAVDAVLPDWRNRRFSRGVDAMVVGLDKLDRRFTVFNHGIGRIFGKGSRNNFVNWTGSMVEGLTTLGTKVVTFPMRAFASIFNTFTDAFQESLVVNPSKLLATGKGLLAVFGKGGGLVGAVAGLAVGAFALGELLPGIVSLMTGLAGVVSALVGSIGIGLTGALFALGPAIAGAIAGFGGLATVFYSFFKNKDNKKFVTDFLKPFNDLGKTYNKQVKGFLTNVKGGFSTLIADIRPSIDTFFSTWSTRMNDVNKKNKKGIVVELGTKGSLVAWSHSIGRIAKTLSNASTSLASGLVGFFVPILPYAERLASYLDRAFASFDKWANSVSGRKQISEFMRGAWLSAQKVWSILGEIGKLFGNIFMGGKDTGDSFLYGILTTLQNINAELATPAGQQKLKDWFGNVKGIGDDIGTLASQIGTMISNFNSPEGQASAQNILDSIVKMGDAAVKVSELADAISRIIGMLNPLATVMGLLGMGAGEGSAPSRPGQSVPTPKQTPVLQQPGVKDALGKYEATLKVTPKVDSVALNKQIAVIEAYKSTGVQIPVKGNADLWEAFKGTIAMTVFQPKSIPIGADPALWNQTKGTVEAYVFNSKTVVINANTKPVETAIANVKKWLAGLHDKTIRVAGVNAPGGQVMGNAAGAIYSRPTYGLFGEAGPEAIVPLDRPLNMVDPSVRALSAFAQGLPNFKNGAVSAKGRVINVHPGAIVVQTPLSDPALVAEAVLDRLVAFA